VVECGEFGMERQHTSCAAKNEKADVAEHPQAFGHVGLLTNEPLGTAELLSI
jgi:hypothetical protein